MNYRISFIVTRLDFHFSPNIIRVIKEDWMGQVCGTNGEERDAYRILVGKPEGKRPLGRPRRRCVDDIKLDHRNIVWDGVDCIDLAQDRDQWRDLVNTVMNLRVP
jgi:hypothetical protein